MARRHITSKELAAAFPFRKEVEQQHASARKRLSALEDEEERLRDLLARLGVVSCVENGKPIRETERTTYSGFWSLEISVVLATSKHRRSARIERVGGRGRKRWKLQLKRSRNYRLTPSTPTHKAVGFGTSQAVQFAIFTTKREARERGIAWVATGKRLP